MLVPARAQCAGRGDRKGESLAAFVCSLLGRSFSFRAILALDEVDDHRHAVERVALAQPVLDEVRVVARDRAGAS